MALCIDLGLKKSREPIMSVVSACLELERGRERCGGVGVAGCDTAGSRGGVVGSLGAAGARFDFGGEPIVAALKDEAEPAGGRRLAALRERPEPMCDLSERVMKEPSPKVSMRACAAENISLFSRSDGPLDLALEMIVGVGLSCVLFPWTALGRQRAPVRRATGEPVMEGRFGGKSLDGSVGVTFWLTALAWTSLGVAREGGRVALAEVGRGDGVGMGELFVGVPDSVYLRLRGIDLPLLTWMRS